MDNLEDQEYNNFMGKLNLKVMEIQSDYQYLSDSNKKRFVKDLCAYFKHQGIMITAQAIHNIMAQRRQF